MWNLKHDLVNCKSNTKCTFDINTTSVKREQVNIETLKTTSNLKSTDFAEVACPMSHDTSDTHWLSQWWGHPRLKAPSQSQQWPQA